MNNLMHFLKDLATNPGKQHAFMIEPDVVMNEAGLSETDKQVLRSGDPRTISTALADEHLAALTFGDPGPDPAPDPDPPEED